MASANEPKGGRGRSSLVAIWLSRLCVRRQHANPFPGCCHASAAGSPTPVPRLPGRQRLQPSVALDPRGLAPALGSWLRIAMGGQRCTHQSPALLYGHFGIGRQHTEAHGAILGLACALGPCCSPMLVVCTGMRMPSGPVRLSAAWDPEAAPHSCAAWLAWCAHGMHRVL